MKNKWEGRFDLLRGFGWMALGGFVLGSVALLTTESVRLWTGIFGALLLVPGFLYAYVIVIWHWKERYLGKHGDLWGAIILIETSGWFKIVYVLRHIVPDMRHSGRYRARFLTATEAAAGDSLSG